MLERSNTSKIMQVGMLDIKGNEQVRRVYAEEGLSPTLNTMGGGNRQPKVMVKQATRLGYAIASVGDSINLEQPNSKTRRAGQPNGILDEGYRIRKLVPLECFRLMGFTDEDYWKARKALEETFYNGGDRSNSQMYKMSGNSIVVDVLEGILGNLFK